MIKWLKETPIPITQISKTTGISRNTLYSWLSGSSDIRDSNYKKVSKHYSSYFSHEEEGSSMDTSHVGLLKRQVESMNAEIVELKQIIKTKQVESTHWDNLSYDAVVNVKVHRVGFKIGRTIESIDGIEIVAEKTGYSVEELHDYYAIGVKYDDMNSHPINTLLCDDTKEQLQTYTTSFPYLLDSLKNMVGNHYIPIPITYKCKDGKNRVHTIAYNKIDWVEMTVVSKMKILDMNE